MSSAWNRPYTRYLPSFHMGLKQCHDRGISRGKQVIKFANTSNCGWVCLFLLSKWEDHLMVMQNVQFKFWQNLCHYCLLHKNGHLHCVVATASRKVTTINSTHNLPLSSLRWKVLHFLLSRMNKLNCDLLHWKFFCMFPPWETTWRCFYPINNGGYGE